MSDQDSATMTGHLKVSVLLPVYNAGEYLEPCLDSVFGQPFDPACYLDYLEEKCKDVYGGL